MQGEYQENGFPLYHIFSNDCTEQWTENKRLCLFPLNDIQCEFAKMKETKRRNT